MKNNFFYKLLQSIIYPACFYFTVCIFVTSIIAFAGNEKAMAANLSFMVMLFIFSLFMAIINKILLTKLNSVLKILLHFLGTLLSFYLVFIVFSGYYKSGQKSFFIIICMILAYAVVLAVIMLIKHQINKKSNDKTKYEKQFGP